MSKESNGAIPVMTGLGDRVGTTDEPNEGTKEGR